MGNGRLRLRFWIEAAMGSLCGILVVITLMWHDWAEAIFGIDPDEGTGAFEVAVTLVAVILTVVFVLVARIEWQRAQLAKSS